MVSLACILVSRPFKVKDVEAFKRALRDSGFEDVEVEVLGDGRVWIGGEGETATLAVVDPETDEERYLEDVVREHIAPGEVAVIKAVCYEGLRDVDGAVLVVSANGSAVWTMKDAEEGLLRRLSD